MACEEKEAHEDLEPAPRIPAHFVIEKLLQVGADTSGVDENGDTPLHILLSNPIDKHCIVKLLLDWGAPLYARNKNDETCFQLIQKKYNIMRTVRVGRYIFLKQLAANATKRNNIDKMMINVLPAELDQWLQIY